MDSLSIVIVNDLDWERCRRTIASIARQKKSVCTFEGENFEEILKKEARLIAEKRNSDLGTDEGAGIEGAGIEGAGNNSAEINSAMLSGNETEDEYASISEDDLDEDSDKGAETGSGEDSDNGDEDDSEKTDLESFDDIDQEDDSEDDQKTGISPLYQSYVNELLGVPKKRKLPVEIIVLNKTDEEIPEDVKRAVRVVENADLAFLKNMAKGKYFQVVRAGFIFTASYFENIRLLKDEFGLIRILLVTKKKKRIPDVNYNLMNRKKRTNLLETYDIPFSAIYAFIIRIEKFDLDDSQTHMTLEEELYAEIIRVAALNPYMASIAASMLLIPLSFLDNRHLIMFHDTETLLTLNQAVCENMKDEFKKEQEPLVYQYQKLLIISSLLDRSEEIMENYSAEYVEGLKNQIKNTLKNMDYSILLRKEIGRAYVLSALKDKEGASLHLYSGLEKLFYSGNQKIMSMSNLWFELQFFKINGNKIYIEGTYSVPLTGEPYRPLICINGKLYPVQTEDFGKDIMFFDEIIIKKDIFKAEFELNAEIKDKYNITFYMEFGTTLIPKKKIKIGKFMPFAENWKESYYYRDGFLAVYDNANGRITVTAATKEEALRKEKEYEKALWNKKIPAARKAALVRKYYFYRMRKGLSKKIWLVSDRTNRGDDNGEALFHYFIQNKDKLNDYDIYFVVEKKSPVAKELSKIGKVIEPMSWKHKMMHLLSDYVISSQGNDPVVNPFHKKQIYYRDIMCDEKFVFLQHGITKDNQSAWLNKYNRNIYGLIVTTKDEYESMLEYNYYYDESRIWLTGMPRYDKLYHAEKKQLTIMPTWRKSLMSGTDPQTGIWQLKPGFENSDYLKFYNDLLNDERLIAAAEEMGYRICYMPHPNVAPYIAYFRKHPKVEFFAADRMYRDVFAETDVLVTDYSSVAFDFAYLRKPIVYCQFDCEDFFNGSHSYTEGYFDYERDGFGEITRDLDSTVEVLIQYMKNGCSLKPLYRERIDHTFAFSDQNCSERVLKKLLGE